jgi:hypothetical protein
MISSHTKIKDNEKTIAEEIAMTSIPYVCA